MVATSDVRLTEQSSAYPSGDRRASRGSVGSTSTRFSQEYVQGTARGTARGLGRERYRKQNPSMRSSARRASPPPADSCWYCASASRPRSTDLEQERVDRLPAPILTFSRLTSTNCRSLPSRLTGCPPDAVRQSLHCLPAWGSPGGESLAHSLRVCRRLTSYEHNHIKQRQGQGEITLTWLILEAK